MRCMTHCPKESGGGVLRAVAVVAGLVVGAAVLRVAAAVVAFVPLLVVAEGVVALGMAGVLVVRVRAARPRAVRTRVRAVTTGRSQAALPAVYQPRAIESGLLAGQTDPAIREMLEGVSARLRAQYGTLEPVEGRVVVPVARTPERGRVERSR